MSDDNCEPSYFMSFERFKKSENIKKPEKIKEGVDFVFQQNPELKKIGSSMEKYSEWLDSVFPDSSIKEILWHRTGAEKFDKFDKNFIGSNSGDLGYYGTGFCFYNTRDMSANDYGYGDNIVAAVLNLKNPANGLRFSPELSGVDYDEYIYMNNRQKDEVMDTATKFTEYLKKENFDGNIVAYNNYVHNTEGFKVTEYVVFEPE